MNVLACDTATAVMHLALVRFEEDKPVFYETSAATLGNKHSELLIPRILELCGRCNIDVKDIDLLVCTSGPGSFTGLRIAMSTLKGISLATGKPLVSVPTLDVYQGCVNMYPGAVLATIDAKKQRFYAALFVDGQRKSEDLDLTTQQIEQLLSGYHSILLTGADASLLAHKLSEPLQKKVRVDTYAGTNLALVLAERGRKQYLEQGSDDVGKGPSYVRKSDAEIALQQLIHSLEVSHD
nr:tRNA (adenosine(37)-N6)-threonylcarbamoyltransferase complex dimerization subunit type 1 TsaB [uncultured Sphaerochaeta sp.]